MINRALLFLLLLLLFFFFFFFFFLSLSVCLFMDLGDNICMNFIGNLRSLIQTNGHNNMLKIGLIIYLYWILSSRG